MPRYTPLSQTAGRKCQHRGTYCLLSTSTLAQTPSSSTPALALCLHQTVCQVELLLYSCFDISCW